MVDAHFSRALRQVCKAKAPAAKTKKIRKSVKLGKHRNKETLCETMTLSHTRYSYRTALCPPTEDSSSCQGRAAGAYTEPQVPPVAGRLLSDDAPGTWHSFPARTGGEGPVFPSITYSLSPEGLSLTGQQYATSLLHLLHSDRSEMGSGVASSMASSVASTSKPELLSSWTVPQGFRDAVDPAVSFEPGNAASLQKPAAGKLKVP